MEGHALLLISLFHLHFHTVDGRFPKCQFHWEMERAATDCLSQLHTHTHTAGCHGEWDNVSCWLSAAVNQTMTIQCPAPIRRLFGRNGNLNRKCTESGWSKVYPDITDTCWPNDTDEPSELVFYKVVKILSTLGHSLSLIALLTSSFILCLNRRLHCTRNYIHLNLFVSFMLRAVAVLAKDAILFSDDEHTDCSAAQPSLVGCKSILVFFQYSIMANFFWLLVEGLYLHTLLVVVHVSSSRLSMYLAIGWGIPFVFIVAWIVCRINLEDTRCWEFNESPIPDRLINWPIMASVIINFVLFISIIRILVQKLTCTDVGGNGQAQYRRLAKSTLLLIPLFGVNYVVFIYLMDPADKNMKHAKIFFEVGLGTFQGLVVAVLYCFLNSEVQSELRRAWGSVSVKRLVGTNKQRSKQQQQQQQQVACPRSNRAQSILQTETTVL